jgi:hypothetical protein
MAVRFACSLQSASKLQIYAARPGDFTILNIVHFLVLFFETFQKF